MIVSCFVNLLKNLYGIFVPLDYSFPFFHHLSRMRALHTAYKKVFILPVGVVVRINIWKVQIDENFDLTRVPFNHGKRRCNVLSHGSVST